MKLLALIAGLLALAGCTSTEFSPETKTFKRTSFLQKTDVGEVRITKDGAITLKGYKNDGGNEALAAAVRAAVEGAIAGASPAP